MVYQMNNPWTQTGRQIQIEKGVAEIYARYFARGPKWVAKHLPQREEMSRYGDKVSQESREILLGDFGVESFIEDYALWATYASGEGTATGQIYTQWVSDETRHSRALWYCLVDSGLYTQQEVDEYFHECSQDVWTFERQTGHEPTPERGAAYAIGQERQTKRNYQGMQKRLWEEYGCPEDSNGEAGVSRHLGCRPHAVGGRGLPRGSVPGDHAGIPALLAGEGAAGDMGRLRKVPDADRETAECGGLYRSSALHRASTRTGRLLARYSTRRTPPWGSRAARR